MWTLRTGYSALAGLVCGVLIWAASPAGVLAAPPSAGAGQPWNTARMTALFPKPGRDWQAGDIEVRRLPTITSEMESFTTALSGSAAGVSQRLKVTRHYSSGDRSITVRIDTSDIEVAAQADGVVTAATHDAALREKLAKDGLTAGRLGAYPVLKLQSGNEAGRIVKVGTAGVVSLECAYEHCAADLDRMLARLDLEAIAAFIAFRHVKPRNSAD